MKRRYRRMINVSALALLLFALYLNFVKKDTSETAAKQTPGSGPAKVPEAGQKNRTDGKDAVPNLAAK